NTSTLPASQSADSALDSSKATSPATTFDSTTISPNTSSTIVPQGTRPRPCVPLTRAEAILKARKRVQNTGSQKPTSLHTPYAPSPLANELSASPSASSQRSNAQTNIIPPSTKATPAKMTQSDASDEILPLNRDRRRAKDLHQPRPRPILEPIHISAGQGVSLPSDGHSEEPASPPAQKENSRDMMGEDAKEKLARLRKQIVRNAHQNRFSNWPTASPELLTRCRVGPGTDRCSKEYQIIAENQTVPQTDIPISDYLPGSSHVFEENLEDASPVEQEKELRSRLKLYQEVYKKTPTAFPILELENLTLSPTPTAKHKKALARIRMSREMAPDPNKPSKGKNNVQILQASWADPVILDWKYCPRYIVDEKAYHLRFQTWLDDTIKRECPVDIFHQAFFNGTAHADGEASMFMLDMRNYETLLHPEDKAASLHAHETAAGYAYNVNLQNEKAEQVEEHRKKMMRKAQIEYQQSRPLRSPSSPVANIYLRPVRDNDVPGLKDIYNWYGNDSFESPHSMYIDDGDVRQFIEASRNATLPFIVAVDRQTASTRAETILGYARAKEYDHYRTSYFTVELEVYVKEGHTGLGIGRCLLDKLLEVCDPSYQSKSGYLFEATYQERSAYIPGGSRKLARLLFTLGYVDHEVSKHNRVKRWLKEHAEFEEQGVLRGVRIKRKFLVNLAYLVRNVGYSTSNKWEP
ncbi:hypothetical protein BJX70DRAFT_410583, partial [Aspergillus crustosus]